MGAGISRQKHLVRLLLLLPSTSHVPHFSRLITSCPVLQSATKNRTPSLTVPSPYFFCAVATLGLHDGVEAQQGPESQRQGQDLSIYTEHFEERFLEVLDLALLVLG